MRIMRLALSSKLFLLLLFSLAGVLIPTLTVTYSHLSESSLQADKQNFFSSLRLVKESINQGVFYLNAFKVERVVRGKQRLRRASYRFGALRALTRKADPAAQLLLGTLANNQEVEFGQAHIQTGAFIPASLREAPQSTLMLTPELTDLKGRTLAETVEHLPAGGDFAIFRLPSRDLTLMHLLPDEDFIVFSAVSIQDMENEIESVKDALLLDIENDFASIHLYDSGFAALMDAGGAVLYRRGVFTEENLAALEPLSARARAEGRAEEVLSLRRGPAVEKILAVAGYSRPFGWSTVLAVPMREISASSRALLTRLILQNLSLGLLSILAGLLIFARVLRPLRRVVRNIALLPDTDFSAPDAAAVLARDLPLERRDEVGDLARAFASMGEQLHRNILARMQETGIRERMQGELNAARDIQRGILPASDPAPDAFGTAASAMLAPALETGGDLYDFFVVPDGRYAYVIGDVSGKGVPAALFMAVTVTLVHSVLNGGGGDDDDLGAAMGRINDLLEARNPGSMFVTLFLALYDPATGRLEYVNGGHNPPLLAGGSAPVRTLKGLSGLMPGVAPGQRYTPFTHTLREGEVCLLYTDGVTEAIDEHCECYGEERLMRCLEENRELEPQALIAAVFADIRNFRGKAAPFDDITRLAFARNARPEGQPSGVP
jgi:sigma-B regulation protein RsbU (phosphoserine phosphatase)